MHIGNVYRKIWATIISFNILFNSLILSKPYITGTYRSHTSLINIFTYMQSG